MTFDHASYYSALSARDARFDGVFYVGVTSTGIYCRPICPARTPKRANCRFFDSAQAAEQATFRPCLRCRPELAPGTAPVDDAKRIAHQLVQRMEDGHIRENANLDTIAAQFDLSPRQMRRIVQQEMGVPPIALLQSRRLLLAKQLLTETALPVTEIAFASGFASVRRFNAAFLSRYRLTPRDLRRSAVEKSAHDGEADTSTVQLAYRPPYDWDGVLAFLRTRMLAQAEWVTDDGYARTVDIGAHRGWIHVSHDTARHTLRVRFTHGLTPVLPALLNRVRALFDVAAQPDLITARLSTDPHLAPLVARAPGLRVPGAFDGFELAVRAVLGQQVTVKAATTLAGRFAEAFGATLATPFPQLTRCAPTAARIARVRPDAIATLGIVKNRATAIVALARAVENETLNLTPGADPAATMTQLTALPGIGPWTAHYIAMRALRWPDAFPKEDIVVRKVLGGLNANAAETASQDWRPWRSYAVLHLWRAAAQPT